MKIKMKTKKFIYLLAPLFLLASCAKTEFDPIPLESLLKDPLEITTTIKELKAEFMTDRDTFSDPVGKMAGLYTADLIKSETSLVIGGYITSSDIEGNMYKYFVIQEDAPDGEGQALKVSVDVSGLSAEFPLGQKVFVRTNGLYIGKYGEAPQLGSIYVNTSRTKLGPDSVTYYRIEPGRMPAYMARTHIFSTGMPQPDVIKADTMTVREILNADHKELVNKLVCIKDAYFTGFDGTNKPLAEGDAIFAPSTNGVGYPQLRKIADATGAIDIATSEYAKFATKPLPVSTYRGDITVIVGWYRNYVDQTGSWQLTMRSLGDLGRGFESYLEEVEYK